MREAIGEVKCKALLTACDKTGRFFGIGKLTWLKLLMASEDEELFVSMKEFGETDKFTDHQVDILSKFISIAYTKKKVSLPEARWVLFTELKEGEQLLPTQSSFYQHLLRALFQTFIWKSSDKCQTTELDPLNFGYRYESESWLLKTMLYPAISPDILDFVRCNCKGKCNTRHCSCKGAITPMVGAITPMVCTELCGCTGCENVDPDEIDGIESDNSSDEDHE